MAWVLWSGLTTQDMKVYGSIMQLQVKESSCTSTEMSMMVSGATIEQMVSGFTRRYRELSMLANG